MKHLILERFCYSPQGTFGTIQLSQVRSGLSPIVLYTIELPWQYNEREKSCIPQASFICKRFSSAKHPNTFEVTNVPARTGILFHVGNTKDDFQGCIGLGLNLGTVGNRWAVLASGVAFGKFMDYLKDDQEFRLTITQYKPQ